MYNLVKPFNYDATKNRILPQMQKFLQENLTADVPKPMELAGRCAVDLTDYRNHGGMPWARIAWRFFGTVWGNVYTWGILHCRNPQGRLVQYVDPSGTKDSVR